MAHSIEIDDVVWEHLQSRAEPFVDTPNTVLRRLLAIDGDTQGSNPTDDTSTGPQDKGTSAATKSSSPASSRSSSSRSRSAHRRSPSKKKQKSGRAPAGSLLPEGEYELPLLETLKEAGGSGPASEIIEATGERLDGKLTELDRDELASGQIRWKNRMQFVRLRLIERGLMVKNSPRGIWAISDAGHEWIADQRDSISEPVSSKGD